MAKRVLFWFRNNLRVSDNFPLLKASREVEALFPVYCFDERWFRKDRLGFVRTDWFRLRFLIETVVELQESLKAIGSGLYIAFGKPEDQIPPLAYLFQAEEVWTMREDTINETRMEKAIETALNMPLRLFDVSSLIPGNLIPFPADRLPLYFPQFRKLIENALPKVKPVEPPVSLPPYPSQWGFGEIPDVQRFGIDVHQARPTQNEKFVGGEKRAIGALSEVLSAKPGLESLHSQRDRLESRNGTTNLSPWLAVGALSPRSIFSGIRHYVGRNGIDHTSEWLVQQLLLRDFYHLVARRTGPAVFQKKGIGQFEPFYRDDKRLFKNWAQGQTGKELVDAIMTELRLTGFLSNRARQIAANFLCKDLKIDWRDGARWFESRLLDYDAANNWVNWMYVAGVGNDPKPNRYFNLEKQCELFDPDHAYRNAWLRV